ncbi:MAG: peptidyl-prolyl cis-trans isomerase [Acidimicrobiales bacterium]
MKRLLALFLVVAAAVALAGIYLPSDAATVGSVRISRQSLDSDLSAIAQSPGYTCFLSEEREISGGSPVPMLGAGTASAKGGVYDTTFVDSWLGSIVTDHVATQLAAEERLSITTHDLAAAKAVLERRVARVLSTFASDSGSATPGCGGSAAAVLSTLPGWFVSDETHAEAAQDVIDARAAGGGLTGPALAAYYDAHRVSFDRDCISVIGVTTRSTAQKVEAALRSGTSFATEAALASATKSTSADGGVAGCGELAGTFLSAGLASLQVGAVTAPLQGDGGYWVVRLTKRIDESLASERPTVVTSMLAAGEKKADAALTGALKRTTVSVDPRYGAMSPGNITLVLPPSAPPGTDVPSAIANTPALTAASG